MRRVGSVIGLGAFFWASMAAASTYTVKTVIGPGNATLGTYVVEIIKDGEQWTTKRVRGGDEVILFPNMEELTKELAAGMRPSTTTSEILLINPSKKLIFLGASEPDRRNLSAAELSRAAPSKTSFECFVGFGSTSRRSQGYNACSSGLTKVSMGPAEAVFNNIFNVIFATLSTRKIVDGKAVFEAALASGAIKSVEAEHARAYKRIKSEASTIVQNGSGMLSKLTTDYYAKVYAELPESQADRGLFDQAEKVSKMSIEQSRKEMRLKDYRESYSQLKETASTTQAHDWFIARFDGYDPDNVHASVRAQIERIKTRNQKEMTVIGNRVCLNDGEHKVIGYIENTSGERLQIRVADLQKMVMGKSLSINRLTYKDVPLAANTIFWDHFQGWTQC